MYARRRRGFTLIELIMVVVILGVLAALVIPNFAGRTQDSKVAAAKTQIESHFGLALSLYETDNGAYPTTEQGLEALIEKPSSAPVPSNWKKPYLQKKEIPLDPFGNAYQYECPGKHNNEGYDLSSAGPDGQHGTEDDISNWAAE